VLEIMFQGHGGHGSVVAAKLLAQAAAKSGYHAQSFASYGALRRGGKVEGYVRISEDKVLLRCKMYRADCLVVMDESLIDEQGTPQALKKEGKILINTARSKTDYPSLSQFNLFTVDAYKIATDKGLVIPGGMPVINTTLLGALAGIFEVLPLEHVIEVIKGGTPNGEKNAACAMEGYQQIRALAQTDREGAGQLNASTIKAVAGRFPAYNVEKMGACHRCQICYMVCPTLAIRFEGDPIRFFVNKEACAGCGICIHECPRHAMSWEE
jgi:pyruvate ferredoxin oxidoreductase gamma subunit